MYFNLQYKFIMKFISELRLMITKSISYFKTILRN